MDEMEKKIGLWRAINIWSEWQHGCCGPQLWLWGSDWLRVITWPVYWPLIGWEWQHGCCGSQLCDCGLWALTHGSGPGRGISSLCHYWEEKCAPSIPPVSPPSPLSSAIQCFTGFIECEMSKYYSLNLLRCNIDNI